MTRSRSALISRHLLLKPPDVWQLRVGCAQCPRGTTPPVSPPWVGESHPRRARTLSRSNGIAAQAEPAACLKVRQNGPELALEARPVGGANHAVLPHQLLVPRVQERRRLHAGPAGPGDVHRAVVDE